MVLAEEISGRGVSQADVSVQTVVKKTVALIVDVAAASSTPDSAPDRVHAEEAVDLVGLRRRGVGQVREGPAWVSYAITPGAEVVTVFRRGGDVTATFIFPQGGSQYSLVGGAKDGPMSVDARLGSRLPAIRNSIQVIHRRKS